MESLILLVPIVISIGNYVAMACIYQRTNNRIQQVEQELININTHIFSVRPQYQTIPIHQYNQPPPPSAPPTPGYGYQYYSGDPTNTERII